jgi:hypothetical protein
MNYTIKGKHYLSEKQLSIMEFVISNYTLLNKDLLVNIKKSTNKTPVKGYCRENKYTSCVTIDIILGKSEIPLLYVWQVIAHEYCHAIQHDNDQLTNYTKNKTNCEIATDLWAIKVVHEFLGLDYNNSEIFDFKYLTSYTGSSCATYIQSCERLAYAINNPPIF